MPASTSGRRAGWPEVIGWYLAGTFATVAGWSVMGALTQALQSDVALFLGHVLAIAGIVVAIRGTREWPRRSRIALWAGVVTPFVLAAIALAVVLYAFANSNWTF